MEPETSIHGVNHSLPPRAELSKRHHTDRRPIARVISARHA